ncbi:uncharacterized protein LOC105220736 [Zeugodacus cucurbitae]|uniref:uncharacterized protein LOC105220736 n=1 Tax=Zeugodacus cucurbitae TaxID=28588 RepID=UPI0005968BCE|nr:uncharacterized protein LOC105220736 [Zeugodacus cucurbitae]
MEFALFMAFYAFLTLSHTASITADSNTDTVAAVTDAHHNSSENGYGYEQPEIEFNYPNDESNTHTNYEAFESYNYLDHQSADSKLKPVTDVPMRLLLKQPKANTGKFCKHEQDLRTIVEEREQRRPTPRRLVPYTEVVTYGL